MSRYELSSIFRSSRSRENLSLGAYTAGAALVLGIFLGQGKLVESYYGPEQAEEYVEQNGYTNVELVDTDVFLVGLRGCDEKDALKYEFTAEAPNGVDVEILVCKGLFKGATLRQG